MTRRSFTLVATAAGVALAACSPSIDAEITLVDYGIVAPDTMTAGEVNFRIFVEGVAHHTLTFCPAEAIGTCDGDPIQLRYTRKPEDARDPSVIPDETSAIVMGAGWNADLATDLEVGTYRLYCSIVNHASFGMDRILTVEPAA